MYRLIAIATLFTIHLLWVAGVASAKPNIVFIMADDVGPGDIGLYHRQRTGDEPIVSTPHLDALALAGMRFSDAHSPTALCAPTRYCVMSGNLNYRCYAPWGVWSAYGKSAITKKDSTLGRVASKAGLATAFIGKWHLGGDFRNLNGEGIYRGAKGGDKPLPVDVSEIISGGPQSLGFDYSFTMPCGIQGPMYVAYENGRWSPFDDESQLIHYTKETALEAKFVSDKGPGMGDSHWNTREVGDLLSKKAVKFIQQNAQKEKPFFLCYWSPMVHLPHTPPEEIDGRKIKNQTPSRHLDMLIDLDQQIGRIVEALKQSGVYENTLFIFSSDNGGLQDGRGEKAGHDSSGGYRGYKNQPYEGGHIVPMFVVWPDQIEAGSESAELVGVHDVLATMASSLDVPLKPEQAKDSLNLLPLLKGEEGFQAREEMLLQGGSGNQLIYRKGKWKLIIQTNHKLTKWDPMALFNLEEIHSRRNQAIVLTTQNTQNEPSRCTIGIWRSATAAKERRRWLAADGPAPIIRICWLGAQSLRLHMRQS